MCDEIRRQMTEIGSIYGLWHGSSLLVVLWFKDLSIRRPTNLLGWIQLSSPQPLAPRMAKPVMYAK